MRTLLISLALLAAVEIWASRVDPTTGQRGKPWKVPADQIELHTPAGNVAAFWVEDRGGRLRIHSNDCHELVPHWIAANVLEIEMVNDPPSNPGYK